MNNPILTEETLNIINSKTHKSVKQMLTELGLYKDGEEITYAEAMNRIEPSYQLILKQANGVYRWFRFNALIRGNTHEEILYYKYDGGTKTRYAIIREDKDNYYIATIANDVTCENSIGIAKDKYSQFARITEEKVGK